MNDRGKLQVATTGEEVICIEQYTQQPAKYQHALSGSSPTRAPQKGFSGFLSVKSLLSTFKSHSTCVIDKLSLGFDNVQASDRRNLFRTIGHLLKE